MTTYMQLSTTVEAEQYTGKNGFEVKQFVNSHADFSVMDDERFSHDKDYVFRGDMTWFFTKGMSASTGGQAWNYIKWHRNWGQHIKAAVYNHLLDLWLPVQGGDFIVQWPSDGVFVPISEQTFWSLYREMR